MKLFFIDKRKGKRWEGWKESHKCSEPEFRQANLRELKRQEIVLDFETIEDSMRGINEAAADNYNFCAYDSGSRGYHLHFLFNDLLQYSEEERKEIRLRFIKHYKADESKKTGLIARENKRHFKTGKRKRLVKHFHPLNENTLPKYTTTFVEGGLEGGVEPDDREIISQEESSNVLQHNPKVLEAVMILRGDLKPQDRSGKDFLITKCFIENGLSKMQIFNFLKDCKHSKIHSEGWQYYDYTYKNVIRCLNR